jgi:hypothetical protein
VRSGSVRGLKVIIFEWANVDLAMSAFGMLRELFDHRELGRVYNVLMEKEIRLHGELEGMDSGIAGIEARQGAIELPLDESSDNN